MSANDSIGHPRNPLDDSHGPDPMMAASEPLAVAARRVDGARASTEQVVPLDQAQRIRDEAVRDAKASYEDAVGALAALVEVARNATRLATAALAADAITYATDALEELHQFVDRNHPVASGGVAS